MADERASNPLFIREHKKVSDEVSSYRKARRREMRKKNQSSTTS